MSKFSINSIDVHQFCDIQGVSNADRIVLIKKYQGIKKSYTDFYEEISKEFQLSDKKNFPTEKKK